MNEASSVNKFKIEDDDVIVFEFDRYQTPKNEALKIFEHIKQQFPNNKLIAIPNSASVGVLDKGKSIDLLERILEELKK